MSAALLTVLQLAAAASTHPGLAESARAAFARHEFAGLLGPRELVRLEIARGSSGSVVKGPVAAAVLQSRVRRQRTREVVVVRAEPIEGRRGFIELRRVFQLHGSAETRSDRILLGTVLDSGTWRISEVLFVEEDPAGSGTGRR